MNLRELTRKVARNVGINLPAVQLFGKQMLAALYHMHDCGVLHADIKPDNILVNARHNAVKVGLANVGVGFGSPAPRRLNASGRSTTHADASRGHVAVNSHGGASVNCCGACG